jgi:hypothetical protein
VQLDFEVVYQVRRQAEVRGVLEAGVDCSPCVHGRTRGH